jgi:uncharacterized membrane protein YhaH (DUF805 family)
MGIGDEIEKLHGLKEQGILTEGEYLAQKQLLLTGQNRPTGFVRPYNSQQSYGASSQQDADLSSRGRLQAKEILFSWEGRIPRVVYWSYGLLLALFVGVCGLSGAVLGGTDGGTAGVGFGFLAALWPSYAIQCKRWHDRDMSGWWSLINFIPYLGALVAFIACGCMRGTSGPNRFGPDHTDIY